ncbi:MAG: metal-dependent transcriptional regulator [bacterium]|nr:metal-dependent transcriptional regulator [bacterium]
MINKTREDYLRAIYHLEEEQHNPQVDSINLCKYLKVAKPSVSEMLKKLKQLRLIEHASYKKIRLTPKGKRESILVTKKHRIIESFLFEILHLNPTLIHKEAHKLEHAFSDKAIAKINVLLKKPKFCPHGKPI